MHVKWNIRKVNKGTEIISFSCPVEEIKEVIEELTIPSMVDGEKITKISSEIAYSFDSWWDLGVTRIKKVVVEKGIEKIDCRTFSDIEIDIDNFYWPDTCEVIPYRCFWGSNIFSIEGIESVKSIETEAFSYSKLIRIKWPSQCCSIPPFCFVQSGLKEITGTKNIEEIGRSAFLYTNLESFKWPYKCFSIPENCFACSNLSKIDGIEKVKEIGAGAFSKTKLKNVIWPTTCKVIPSCCFWGTPIETITNINNVNDIGGSAFASTQITQFDWPAKCPVIPTSCFQDTPLERIHGTEQVEEIKNDAFKNTELREFTWPANVDAKKCRFLEKCSQLKKITFSKCGMRDIDLSPFQSMCQKQNLLVDVSCAAIVNFINDSSSVYEKIKDNIKLPYYVLGKI